METIISWPSHLADGSHFLYLVEEAQILLGSGTCKGTFVNPLNITVGCFAASTKVMTNP